MRHGWIACVVLLSLADLGGSAVAETRDQIWALCNDDPDRDLQIGGCSAIIQSHEENVTNVIIALNNRGLAFARKGQHIRAIQDFDQAIRLDSNNAQAFYNRGIPYFDLGQLGRAIQDFDEAIRLNPNYANAYYNRGIAYRALGLLPRAAEDLAKARELNPRLPPLPR